MEKFKHHSLPSKPELQMKKLLDDLGFQYEYQMPVRSGYVLDFAFPELMKAIEVDGYYHQFQAERDDFRDSMLQRAGWKILRIRAEAIAAAETVLRIQNFLCWVGSHRA